MNLSKTILATSLLILSAAASASSPQVRIINGSTVHDTLSPAVRLSMNSMAGSYQCSGALITPNVVLTAAHCFDVALTSISVSTNKDLERYKIISYVQHPDWAGIASSNSDIAIAFVEEKMSHITPYELPTNEMAQGSRGHVSGYGLMSDGELTKVLQTTTFEVTSDQACHSYFDGLSSSSPEKFLCTKPVVTGSESCNGDSGGPLSAGNTLYGLVNFGQQECHGEVSGNAEVYGHLNWIQSTIEANGYEAPEREGLGDDTAPELGGNDHPTKGAGSFGLGFLLMGFLPFLRKKK